MGHLSVTPPIVVFEEAFEGYAQDIEVVIENVGQATLTLEELNWDTGVVFEFTGPQLPLLRPGTPTL